MKEQSTICTFKIEKQHAFDEACCAFAKANNMSAIANAIGMSPTVLRNKLNPEQPHVMTCVDLIAIAKVSQDFTILNSLLLGLGVVTAPVQTDSNQETFIKRALENSLIAGDLSRMALEHAGETRLTRNVRHTIINKAQQGISNLVLLISDLESRTASASPFFSMGVDFVANGGSVPGLI